MRTVIEYSITMSQQIQHGGQCPYENR